MDSYIGIAYGFRTKILNLIESFDKECIVFTTKNKQRFRSSLQVGKKYRYPQFVQMQWYVVERVVRRATKRQYLDEISAELPAAYKCFAKGAPAAMEDEEKAKKEEAEEMSPAAESPAVLLPNASAAAAAIEHRPLTAHQSSSGTDAAAAGLLFWENFSCTIYALK